MRLTEVKNLSYAVAQGLMKGRKYNGKWRIMNQTHISLLPNNNIEVYWWQKPVAQIRPDNNVILLEPPRSWPDRAYKFFNIRSSGVDVMKEHKYVVGWTMHQTKYAAGASNEFVFETGMIINPLDFKVIKGRNPAELVYDKDKASEWRKRVLKFFKIARTYAKLGTVQEAVNKRINGPYVYQAFIDYTYTDRLYHHIMNDNFIEFIEVAIEQAHRSDVLRNKNNPHELIKSTYMRYHKPIKMMAGIYQPVRGISYDHDRVQETTERRADQVAANVRA